jgi:hypothetical protein
MIGSESVSDYLSFCHGTKIPESHESVRNCSSVRFVSCCGLAPSAVLKA